MAEHVTHARDCRYRVAPTAAAVVRVEEQPDARVPQRAHELGGTIDVVPPPPTARPRRGAVRRSKSLARPRRGLPRTAFAISPASLGGDHISAHAKPSAAAASNRSTSGSSA